MRHVRRCAAIAVAVGISWGMAPTVDAQDLYDPATLRTFSLTFHDADWKTRLRSNYTSQTYILADLDVDGATYLDVGVRIRGNTSYTSLPTGSDKFSLKIKTDYVHDGQSLYGYDTLNLNNGFHDPTFVREIVYNNYVAQFIPNPRANHVVVRLNGDNWGVYNNVQQGNKSMLRNYFDDTSGMRVSCANNPNGPGLAYNGPNASGYSAYEIQDDGGLADAMGALINVTYVLSNEPLTSWQNIDKVFAIDPSIWSVALENALTDDDSYVNKGCDFAAYRTPADGRLHLIQRDANESFTAPTWAIDRNFTATNKPVLRRVLAVPQLRQRYFAHYRRIRADMNWDTLGPLFTAQRAVIEQAVQNDPKKLYSYQLFQDNFTSTVNLPYSGPAGGSLVGLQQFVTQRASLLAGNAELSAKGPAISAAQASLTRPRPSEPVRITATVLPNGNPVTAVELFYRDDPTAPYKSVAMLDDGQSGDGAAGDGVYGTLLPVSAHAGQRVFWYVGATAQNTYQSVAFLPELAERGPNVLTYGYDVAGNAGIHITEFMYQGAGGEFVEFTNTGATAVDMTGWSFDDDHDTPGAFDLGAFGIVQPGESVILTETDAETFRANWQLASGIKIIGLLGASQGNNLSRNDQIHLFDANSALQDVLVYGDQDHAGTIRTQNASGQAECAALGQNRIADWKKSVVGDAFGSVAANGGDVGTPGRYITCVSDADRIFASGFDPVLQ